MNEKAHKTKIQEYLAEMADLATDLTEDNMRKMYCLKVQLEYVMCCYYRAKWLLPPIKVQSSKFRANPEKYCKMADKQIVEVYGEAKEGEKPLKMSFGGINPLDNYMDASLCEICLSGS